MILLRNKNFAISTAGRLPVSPEDLEKAKKSGVIQIRPDNGKWGIIAIQRKLWWRGSWNSKESAKKSLIAYEARKHSGNL